MKWLSNLLLLSALCWLASCSSPPNPITDPIHLQPEEVTQTFFRTPGDDWTSDIAKIRTIVKVLPSMGDLLAVEFDADGDGPLPPVPVALTPMGLHEDIPVAYNWWYFDFELPVSDEVIMTACYFVTEQGERYKPTWMSVNHGHSQWPF